MLNQPFGFYTTNTLQHLEFDITDDDHFLQINGQPVFPPPRTLIPIALKAEQIRKSDQSHTKPLRLGYAMEVLPTISEVTDISVTPIQFTVLDLQGLVVRVDTVRVDLVQSWGKMHIARITQIPYAESPGANQCTTSICRLRYIIANRLRKMIEAAKAHAGKAKTWIKNGCGGRKHAQAGAKSAHKNSHSNVHDRHGRVRHFIKKAVLFFVPAAVFGILFYCRNRRSRGEGARGLEAAIEDDEKDALVENGEMPPQYEDVDVIVVEEK
jgi:hypothetical protein